MTVFVDGTGVTPGTEGCKCGPKCEMPCWQRIGLTDKPCCPGCAPLPDPPPDVLATITDLPERRGDA